MSDNRTFDWRPKPDPRSEAFRFTNVPMCATLATRKSIRRTKAVWLDQGQEGACTGFGEEHVRALSPYPQKTTNEMARAVYKRAQFLDEWDGEAYEGSSVNGAMKAAREFGYIKGWRWARTTLEARHGLSYHGAGEAGTWWWSGMWNTDPDGFIHPTGSRIGGHAYAVSGFGWLNGHRYYIIDNSWGPAWGVNGQAKIWETDFLLLLDDGGELAFPSKVRF